VSLAATKFGGAAHATEADPSNMAVAAGIPGLAAYAVVAALVLTRAYRLAVTRRDPLSLIALAVVVITFLQWLNGGQYGVALLVWITIGWIDRNTAGARRR
jgi:O-antigen ligase